MIGFLTGNLSHFQNYVIVDVNGVGYEVMLGPRAIQKLQSQDQAELFIHTLVREDEITLYGFLQAQEKALFRLLLNVSGVGPKTSQLIADQGGAAVSQAVQQADTQFFTALPRVGKKLAQKIIIDLRTKLGSVKDLDLSPESAKYLELKDALLGLGFAERDIVTVMTELDVENENTEKLLKQALKKLS